MRLRSFVLFSVAIAVMISGAWLPTSGAFEAIQGEPDAAPPRIDAGAMVGPVAPTAPIGGQAECDKDRVTRDLDAGVLEAAWAHLGLADSPTLDATAAAGLDTDRLPVPIPENCTGRIRPGARMTSPAGCTYNFVYTDGSRFYIGTAGHCTSFVGQRVSASGVGSFGTVVYRINQGGANDFALIRIDVARENLIDSTLCTWGGPTEAHTGGQLIGSPLLEYGWGTGASFVSLTRARAHSAFTKSPTTITWNGYGAGGDSGAPVITADGRAYAIHTFGITPIAGAVGEGGPYIQHALQLARNAGYDISVVPG